MHLILGQTLGIEPDQLLPWDSCSQVTNLAAQIEKLHRGEQVNHETKAIFFDHGNTLRFVVKDAAFQAQAKQQLATLVGAQEPPDVFYKRLVERYKVCRKQAKETLIETSEKELWTRWMLPDWPSDKIAPLAGELTRLWRARDGRRVARPDTGQVIIELAQRGYCLGIIANTITESEIPDWLEEAGLTQYFETVILSSIFGRRKPGPDIYLEATGQAGVDPAQSIYIGDNPSRDITGARLAGFASVIILMEPATLAKEPPTGDEKPDAVIHELSELLDIFPAL